jgi:hypothetical protein
MVHIKYKYTIPIYKMSNNPTCEIVPSYLALTNIKTSNKDYYEVKKIIQDYLKVRPNIVVTYDTDFDSWQCHQKYDDEYYDHGDERVDGISIYWDNTSEQHIVEVRRLKGDTMFHCSKTVGFHPVYTELLDLFTK